MRNFSKSLNPKNIEKNVLDIRIRLQTHYPAGYPTGKPDSDHLWSPAGCTILNMRIK